MIRLRENRSRARGLPALVLTQGLVAFILLLSGCTDGATSADGPPKDRSDNAPAFVANTLAPHVEAVPGGEVLATWIERRDESSALMFSRLRQQGWSRPAEVARGSDWFVNWADFPAVARTTDGRLVTYFLQQSGPGSYAYDIRLTWSDDWGATWADPITPHRDGTQTEHGFVSLLPLPNGRTGVVWLDGRKFASEPISRENAPNGHGTAAEMTLRYAELTPEGALVEEVELDGRTCDCCQTAAVVIPGGVAIFYRDRTADEIRDISVVRRVDGRWLSPATVHGDGWQIAGCPVNGPAAASGASDVVVAWFTAANGEARVYVAFSADGASRFGDPIVLSDGRPLGRVDVQWLGDEALVSWVEQRDSGADVVLQRVTPDGASGPRAVIASTSADRQSGFPRMAVRTDGNVLMTWTDVQASETRVRLIEVTDP